MDGPEVQLFRQLRLLVGTCIASIGALFWSMVLLMALPARFSARFRGFQPFYACFSWFFEGFRAILSRFMSFPTVRGLFRGLFRLENARW